MCACSCASVAAVFVAVDQNVTQIIVQAELKQTVAGGCDCPTVFFVVIHNKTMCFCAVPEFAIVICAASGTILDTICKVMVVYHFMQQGGGYLFNGAR